MTTTTVNDVQNHIQERWAPNFTDELREKQILPSLIDRSFDVPALFDEGDTLHISQVNAITGELLTVGTNADEFNPELVSTSQVDLVVDKRAVASYEFSDLTKLQSMVNLDTPDVMNSAVFAINRRINEHVYSLVSSSTSAPDHLLASTATLDAGELTRMKLLADTANWPEGNRWLLVDPTYFKDLLDDTTLTSADFGASDTPMIGGKMVLDRFGWKIVMDDSAAMVTELGGGTAGVGLAFIPEFMHFVMQQTARTLVSSRHSSRKFTTIMSVDTVFGAVQGIDGDNKSITITVA